MTTRAQAVADAEVYRSLGVRLRALRQARGWSQAVLAHRTRLSVPTVAHLEHGAVRPVDLLHLRTIAAALDTTPGRLIDGTPGPVVLSESAAAVILAASQASGLTAAEVIEQAVTAWVGPLGPPPYPDDDLPARVTGPGLSTGLDTRPHRPVRDTPGPATAAQGARREAPHDTDSPVS